MRFTLDDLRKLLHLIDVTSAKEIDCTEFLHRVAAYLEHISPEGTPPPGFEEVAHHLRVCPECDEEFEALFLLLREES